MKKIIAAALTVALLTIAFVIGIKTGENRVIKNQIIVSDTLIDYDGNLYEYE